MAYNAVQDIAAVSSGSERMEKRVPCRVCLGNITHKSPQFATCWCCYSGWPRITRPETHPENHPNYAATMARIAAKDERRRKWLENRPFLVEAQ